MDHHSLIEPNVVGQISEIAERRPGAVSVDQRSAPTWPTVSAPSWRPSAYGAAKAMDLRNLPSKSWQVNCGWVIAANIAADITAWTRLLGFRDDPGLREAGPDTLRYRVWHIPARLAQPASAP